MLQKQEKQENRLGCGYVLYYCLLNLLAIWQLEMPWFKNLAVHKKKKEMIYTPMGGLLTTNVMVYKNFGG